MANLTLTPPTTGRDVALTVELVSRRFLPWERPENLTVSALLPWLAERGELLPFAVVRLIADRWVAERAD